MSSNSGSPFHNEGHDTYLSGGINLFRTSGARCLTKVSCFNIGYGPKQSNQAALNLRRH
ncbi:hypothetical protein FB460_2276 [Propioniferax innocua]|uniref:Uncharacterized protein n=1 Tax=Propioniferax innocua TaxID=1753 RepID=A0A542ZDJ1_9ACTN|nr:hypothetical protein FB460_2276 [Propioniferax innocua]